MENLSPMVSMAKTPEEAAEDCTLPCSGDAPKYPWGLCLSLDADSLNKLGYTHDDFQPDDMIHLHALACVTSVSHSVSVNNEPTCRVELQITHIACESEDEENEDEEEVMTPSKKIAKLYQQK